jgi:predicted HD superfamily hydrolase involved in NAD metabolism
MHISKIKEIVFEKFKNYPNRLTHTLGVCDMAVSLAKKFNVSEEKAIIAALLHDICKYEDLDTMKRLINDDNIFNEFKNTPEIYHAYAAANYAKDVLNIHDEEIINAIRYHVTGRLNMTLLEEIIFISDYTEINRKYESCIICRNELNKNFYNAFYLCYNYTIEHLEQNNKDVLKIQYQLRDYYKNKGEHND